MTAYQVNEIFTSVQGEGYFTGIKATFIRLQGCTVGCKWCDTKYTWKAGGKAMESHEILKEVHAAHVVITGGEPTLYDLDDLIHKLKFLNCYVQLETSGQREFKGTLWPDWLTVSPKENLDFAFPYSFAMGAGEFKWVIDNNFRLSTLVAAWDGILEKRSGVTDNEDAMPFFYLMPEGSPPSDYNIKKALEYLSQIGNNKWRITDRMQYRFGVR